MEPVPLEENPAWHVEEDASGRYIQFDRMPDAAIADQTIPLYRRGPVEGVAKRRL